MGWRDDPIVGAAPVASTGSWRDDPIAGTTATIAEAPQADETISSMLGLMREPGGQTYFKAPVSKTPEEMAAMPLYESIPTDIAQTFGGGVRAVAGGVRNAVAGVASLPADAAEAMGFDRSPLIDGIVQNLPEIRQEGVYGEIGQAVTQYAPAAVAGAGALGGLVKDPGMLQNIMRMMGAVGADAAVTDPNQASTLGDLVNIGPTNIQPEDNNLEKRFKVGAETAVMEPVANVVKGAVNLGKQGFDAVRGYAKPFTPQGQEDIAAQTIKNLASDPKAAAAKIDETTARIPAGDSFKPLTGEASMDPGLIRAQKGMANTKELGDQTLRNESNISQQFRDDTAPGPVDRTPELRKAVEGEAEGQIAPVRQKLESSNKALADVETQLKTMAEDTARSKGQKTPASENLDATFREVNDKLTAAKNELFDSVDPDGTLKKDGTDFINRIGEVKLEEGQAAEALPSSIVNDVAKLGEDGGEVSFRFLVNMRQRLSDEIGAARASSQGARVDKLLKIKNIVNDEIKVFGEGVGADDAERLGQAFDFYADTFAPTLKEGQAGKQRSAINSNRPGMAPPSATAGKFLTPGMGAKERAQSLKKVLAQAENPEQGMSDVRSYLISDMAESVSDGTKISPERLTAWTDKNREVLAEFPEIRKEVAQLNNRVQAGSTTKKQIEQDILSQGETLKRTEKEVAQSALGTVMKEEDPVKAVSSILGGPNKRQRMRQVIEAAKKDSSGQAMDGLKDAVKRYMRNELTQSTTNFEGDAMKVSFAKLASLQEKNPEVMGVLEDIYGKNSQEIQSLKLIRTKLEILSRKDRVQGTTGSPTKSLEQNESQFESVLAATLAQNFKQNRILNMVSKMLPSPSEGVRQLVLDAMADPQLAKTMLLRPTKENLPRIESELRTYITNNITGAGEDRRQDNKEDDKIQSAK